MLNNHRHNLPETSSELLIQRCGEGIQLIRPEYASNNKSISSVAAILQLPLNVYFLESNSCLTKLNEHVSKTCGFESIKNGLGRSVSDFMSLNDARKVIANDSLVMKSNSMKIVEEHCNRFDEVRYTFISFKFPWYQTNKIIGVFGFSIIMNPENYSSLTLSLSFLIKSGLLSPTQDFFNTSKQVTLDKSTYFSKREKDVLHLLVRGKTAKDIANLLNISHRTVEHHIENAKLKANVDSKSELIDKVFCYFNAN